MITETIADDISLGAPEEWLKARLNGIGASDAAVVIGESKWKSEFTLYLEKTGALEPEQPKNAEACEFGLRLEPVICEALAARTGRPVRRHPSYDMVWSQTFPFMFCTPDAWFADVADWIIQIKTCDARIASEWAEGPPLAYQVQIQHELAVTGATMGTLVVLIGGNRLKYYDCPPNKVFQANLIRAEAKFWRHVQTVTPPTFDFSESSMRSFQRLHPNDNGETKLMPDDAIEWFEAWRDAREKRLDAERHEEAAKNRLVYEIGPYTFGQLPSGECLSYKTQTTAGFEMPEKTYRVLREVKPKTRKGFIPWI